MRKKRVVLLYQDTKYILPILSKLVEMYDEHCDFSLYSDTEIFEREIEKDNEIDVFITDKNIGREINSKLRITDVLLFTDEEKESSEQTSKLNVQLVYKYLSVKEIINEICSCSVLRGIEEAEGIVTDLIVVYSPIGGAGTTTMALGLSEALTNKHKKVLYINVGQLQNHAFRFKDKTPLDDIAVKRFKETDINFYEGIKSRIRTEGFFYLPPFPRCLSSLDLQYRHIVQAITKIRETGVYDYIVIDTSSELNECNSELMAQAENVMIVGKPDAESLYKLKVFFDAIDCTDKNKFRFVCNFADETADRSETPFATDYVCSDPEFSRKSIEELGLIPDIERLGIRYI
ncbi:MAG: AAA family ATPase [Clostridiales bacterium]|nr:AAA family ATPase [Clostridiales bacterium]